MSHLCVLVNVNIKYNHLKPIDKVILQMDAPLQDKVIMSNGDFLYIDPTWNPEFHVTTNAVVKYKPEWYNDIEVGDEVAFSYHVCSAKEYPNIADNFHPVTEGNDYYQEFTNAKGLVLRKQALPKTSGGLTWIGLLTTKNGERIDGIQDTEEKVSSWFSQFKFGDAQSFRYKNLIEIGSQTFWKAKITDIFAKKEDGQIKTVSDRIICQKIVIDLTQSYNIINGVSLPDMSLQGTLFDRATVLSGGEDLGLKKGDIISFEPKYCEKYNIFGVERILIKKNRVNGIWLK